MKISHVDNHSPNFGMKCPPKLRAKLYDALPATEIFSLFKNGDKLAQNISEIGSDNTTLAGVNIVRRNGENFFDAATEIWDECNIVFKMLNAKGKKEKVTAQIRSAAAGEPLADIHRDFVDVTKKAEETFLAKSLEKSGQKGTLQKDTDIYKKLYPERSEFIEDTSDNLALKYNDDEEKGLLGKIISFFSK